MPYKPQKALSTGEQTTSHNIVNAIRSQASPAFRNVIPAILADASGDPINKQLYKIGDTLRGYPALLNEFLDIMNQFGFTVVYSGSFFNAFKIFKKGQLSLGEGVRELFVKVASPVSYDVEKAAKAEFQRTRPQIEAAYHPINWKVYYPVTVEYEEVLLAFTTEDGIADMLGRIIASLSEAVELDDWFLTKYLIARAFLDGKMANVYTEAGADLNETGKNLARVLRQHSRTISMPSTKWNSEGVYNTTPADRQVVVMNAETEANLDVEVLAHAFNMEKAQVNGQLVVLDSFSDFDFNRFSGVVDGTSTQLTPFTGPELAKLATLRAVLIDSNWLQNYTARLIMSDPTTVQKGLYRNYNLHYWATFATSPFFSSIAVVEGAAPVSPATVDFTVDSVLVTDLGRVVTLKTAATVAPYAFIEQDANATAGVAIDPIGFVTAPLSVTTVALQLTYLGSVYNGSANIATVAAGATVTFTKV